MGGIGSGNWHRWDKRETVENCREIDIRRWQREGLLVAGTSFTWAWWGDAEKRNKRAEISVYMEAESVRLVYKAREAGGGWQEVDDRIYLSRTPCHYGGERAWFLCPGCKRRVAKLYAGGIHYACRHCYRLPYACQNETVKDRQIRKTDKLRLRLKGRAGILNPLPGRPKGMHHKTYRRLQWRLLQSQEAALQGLWGSLNKLRSRF